MQIDNSEISLYNCPQGATQGLTSEFLGNLTAVFSLVRTYNSSNPASPIKLYITALNANDANVATPSVLSRTFESLV
jgi:hypothetical protein